MPERRIPPTPRTGPVERPPRRDELHGGQTKAITDAAQAAGVEADPWLAWARCAAIFHGTDEATERAVLGAMVEPLWRGETVESLRASSPFPEVLVSDPATGWIEPPPRLRESFRTWIRAKLTR